MKARGTLGAFAVLLVGCGYGATVEKRGITHQPEPLRIVNRQVRIYQCEGVPAGSQSCQYMRFQVALDRPDPRPGAEAQDRASVQLDEQKDQAPMAAPTSPNKYQICPQGSELDWLRIRYLVRKYPSSEVRKNADRMTSARDVPVKAQLQQRAFVSRVGFTPRWSVDPEPVAGAGVTAEPTPGHGELTLEICNRTQVANLDLVLLDEDVNWCSTGDVYRLEVWRPSQNAEGRRTIETLNTVAQFGLGSAITGVLLIGAYIFFGATR